jgi:uncharacterized protein (TIGR03066 family)
MFVTRILVPVMLLCLAVPASLSAVTVPDKCLILGKWTMSANEEHFSFVHHLEFKANGVLIADDETIINGKKTEFHGQGIWKLNGKRLTVATRETGKEVIEETVDYKLAGNQLEISDGKETITLQRVK